ncbi:C25 family cysteine peptidase [Patulibacter defluvii]|uniref:C25 family cysteine peptidase n=1 Tax=Patulibacter defluvii TaxID=3095358 RepID=UPI002A76557F|nr:C25 family cysteine peptidase [Patulibacter sp. DM4]
MRAPVPAARLAAGLTIVALGGAVGPARAAGPPSTPSAALRSLVQQTTAVPRGATGAARRARLLRLARHARAASAKRPCVAVADLDRYRRALRPAKPRKGRRHAAANRRLAALAPAATTASRLLLTRKGTARCGGGARATATTETVTKVLSSDANGLRVRVQLPPLRFAAQEGGGRTWTRLSLPGTDVPGAPGTPGIPVAASSLAIPDGATLEVDPGATSGYTLDGVDVAPVQADPADGDRPAPDFGRGVFAAKPFRIDGAAYRARGPQPARPAAGALLGTARDLRLGSLRIPAAQYDAARRRLRVLTAVDVKVVFKGGEHRFSDQLSSPWETSQRRLVASLINRGVLPRERPFPIPRCGEELLVITNPATRAAADQLATARSAAGLRSRVVEVGAGNGQIGTTAAQIQGYVRGQLSPTRPCIRPSYVAILGDDDLVPTFTDGPNGIPSDLPYALRDGADELPDVAVGRILGDDAAAVGRAVAKIVGYETTPPTGAFLTRALIAAQFQDTDGAGQSNDGQENRTFIQFAETARSGLLRHGVTSDRIYADSPATTPTTFNDGTPLPAALRKPTFAWNGSGADVSAAWNAGRFLVVHRDHGWSDGWGTPGFTTSDVNALTNGALLPVVLSVNCSSGAYDYDETSFAGEALVKDGGGAVGVFGDTRDSPSWHNSQIALGFLDGLLPSVLPDEGVDVRQRTGDALINGKLRLAGIAPPSGPGISGGDGSTRDELYLWHYFGDPSMQMWGGRRPIVFDPSRFRAVLAREFQLPIPTPDPPPYVVNVTVPGELNGQSISLLRGGEVIGKGIASGGSVQIPAAFGDGSVKPGELRVAVEGDGAVPVSAPVEVPAAEPAATTLTQTCPSAGAVLKPLEVGGTLTGAPAGSYVSVTFTAPAVEGPGRKGVVTATTDGDGRWRAALSPQRSERGSWTVASAYAGDDGHRASSAGPCTIPVQ